MWKERIVVALVCAAAAGCGGSPPAERPAPEDDASGIHGGPRPTGAVGRVRVTSAMAEASGGRIEEVLQGRVAGLRVVRLPNGHYSLRIRGTSTLHADGEPLLVIDGTVVSQPGVGSALASLNPRDVSTVEVLKDAGSTAFYGSRGSNGVIVITTRR